MGRVDKILECSRIRPTVNCYISRDGGGHERWGGVQSGLCNTRRYKGLVRKVADDNSLQK